MLANRGILLAFLASAAFSMKAIFVKLAYIHGVDAVLLLALRMAFSLPALLVAAWWSGRNSELALTPRDWRNIILLGFVGYYLSSLLDFLGLAYVSAGLERLILFLYPTVVVLISVYMFGKSISRRAIFAMVLSYVGIGIAFVHDIEITGDHQATMIGGGLIFLCMITYAVYLVGSGQMTNRMGATRFAALATTVAAVSVMIHFMLASPLVEAVQQPWQVYAYAAGMAVLSTILPIFLTAKAIQLIGASKVSIVGSIGPVATIFFGWLILGEDVSVEQMVGAAFVLGGVMLVSSKKA
ncbi:DMT family transporter [Dongia mobilis]|uniref:DMT family transporter n=1 Tax=Dongia sp. TaxID=1977262 RepID=UPI0026F0400E